MRVSGMEQMEVNMIWQRPSADGVMMKVIPP